ncbi:MAG: flavodoxin family protein [Thermodesulfobacteriota bacterium]
MTSVTPTPLVVAIHGSPRRHGNTSTLLAEAMRGAESAGCRVVEVRLRELKLSPCLEIYGCRKDGRCVIKDDFQQIYEQLDHARGIILASPIFFYAVSAQTKILMDRCQSFWVRRHWLEGRPYGDTSWTKRGLFIAAAASQGQKLFDGALLSVRYFFQALDTELTDTLLCRGLDQEGEVQRQPEQLSAAFEKGRALGALLVSPPGP